MLLLYISDRTMALLGNVYITKGDGVSDSPQNKEDLSLSSNLSFG